MEEDEIDLNDASKAIWREEPIKEGYVHNASGKIEPAWIYKNRQSRTCLERHNPPPADFAEPGFYSPIDEVNEMNNNWFCENIRLLNPAANNPARVRQLLFARFREVHPLCTRSSYRAKARFDWDEYRKGRVRVFCSHVGQRRKSTALPVRTAARNYE